MSRKSFIISFFLILGAGCTPRIEGLLTLKRVAASQKQIDRYLNRQDKLFARLLRDLEREKIKPGLSRRHFIGRYGDPVVTKEISEPFSGTADLYRFSTQYFNSEKVYAYFDESEKLVSWEYSPRLSP